MVIPLCLSFCLWALLLLTDLVWEYKKLRLLNRNHLQYVMIWYEDYLLVENVAESAGIPHISTVCFH